MKKVGKNYTFLWRENYTDYLWARNVVAPIYFQKEGVLVYEYSQLTAYATTKELDAVKKIGKILFVQDGYERICKELATLARETRLKKARCSKQNLRKVSNKTLLRLYEELFDLMRRFLNNYRYTEPHYLDLIEDELDQFLKKQETQREAREYLKAQLLAGTSTALLRSRKMKHLVRFLRKISKRRFEAKSNSITASDYADTLLEETARRFYLAATQVSSLNHQELKGLLLDNIRPDVPAVNRRKESFAFEVQNSKITELTEKQCTHFKNSLLPNQDSPVRTTLKGSTAYPGKVTGKAIVLPLISTAKEYKKFIANFEKNSILVVPMTSPDLVPVFRNVAAIVTDEGGITSHAALIAREMKIPCIVGTSYATKIFKSGMQLLVDATNAQVSII